ANAVKLRRPVKPVDAEVAGFAGDRLHPARQVDVLFVAKKPRHLVDREDRAASKVRPGPSLWLLRIRSRQPSDIDDGTGGLAHALGQRFDASADRAQQFSRRFKRAVLDCGWSRTAAVLDPLQDGDGLAEIVE